MKGNKKWTDYERTLIISHYRKFGKANLDTLGSKMPYRTLESISCEVDKFDSWQRTGVMAYKVNQKYKNSRPGTRKAYTRIIEDLGI